MKHTPGKWETAGEFADGIWITAEDGSLVICRLDSAMDSDINENTDRANANLIASAPELLEMLRELVDFEYLSEYADQDGKIKQAKKLITKAGGE